MRVEKKNECQMTMCGKGQIYKLLGCLRKPLSVETLKEEGVGLRKQGGRNKGFKCNLKRVRTVGVPARWDRGWHKHVSG